MPAKVIATAVYSLVFAERAVATGGSFTAAMLMLTVAAAELTVPSLTRKVKLSGPLRFDAG